MDPLLLCTGKHTTSSLSMHMPNAQQVCLLWSSKLLALQCLLLAALPTCCSWAASLTRSIASCTHIAAACTVKSSAGSSSAICKAFGRSTKSSCSQSCISSATHTCHYIAVLPAYSTQPNVHNLRS